SNGRLRQQSRHQGLGERVDHGGTDADARLRDRRRGPDHLEPIGRRPEPVPVEIHVVRSTLKRNLVDERGRPPPSESRSTESLQGLISLPPPGYISNVTCC